MLLFLAQIKASWRLVAGRRSGRRTDGVRRMEIQIPAGTTPANRAGFDGFFGWILIRILLDEWKQVTL